jgi:hypothetical protein
LRPAGVAANDWYGLLEASVFPALNPSPYELCLREHGITRRAEADPIVQRVPQDVGLGDEVHDRCIVLHLACRVVSRSALRARWH